MIIFLILIFGTFKCFGIHHNNISSCKPKDFFLSFSSNTLQCDKFNSKIQENNFYILYDVNPAEGFNLRRDVYIRMAVFVHNLKQQTNYQGVKLVLPPYHRLYHWKSSHINQNWIFWNHFFNMESFKMFAPVLDFYEFLDEIKSSLVNNFLQIDTVYKLQNFKEMFVDGVFHDKFEYSDCLKSVQYPGLYFNYENITQKEFICLQFQGSAKLLQEVLNQHLKKDSWPKIVLFLNSEIILHDHWGNNEFWQARRSMRFSENLVSVASEFRKVSFNSTNEFDLVQKPKNWIDEKPYRGAIGGDYLCAHLRRGDFIYGREATTPTLKSAANQIRTRLKEQDLDKVFISSDCNKFEYKNLKSYLGRAKVYRFLPESMKQKEFLKDGGVAIVDQIICSHAKFFIGTYESTFTYRIYEEREILGFPKSRTFNVFCKNDDFENCEKNSVWPIVY